MIIQKTVEEHRSNEDSEFYMFQASILGSPVFGNSTFRSRGTASRNGAMDLSVSNGLLPDAADNVLRLALLQEKGHCSGVSLTCSQGGRIFVNCSFSFC